MCAVFERMTGRGSQLSLRGAGSGYQSQSGEQKGDKKRKKEHRTDARVKESRFSCHSRKERELPSLRGGCRSCGSHREVRRSFQSPEPDVNTGRILSSAVFIAFCVEFKSQ